MMTKWLISHEEKIEENLQNMKMKICEHEKRLDGSFIVLNVCFCYKLLHVLEHFQRPKRCYWLLVLFRVTHVWLPFRYGTPFLSLTEIFGLLDGMSAQIEYYKKLKK
jgi:hypothetical protein